MQRIVINSHHGGFGLSDEALAVYTLAYEIEDSDFNILRDDPVLVKVVETLGERANDAYSRLKVVEVPDGVDWTIAEYYGLEWVAEAHRTWS